MLGLEVLHSLFQRVLVVGRCGPAVTVLQVWTTQHSCPSVLLSPLRTTTSHSRPTWPSPETPLRCCEWYTVNEVLSYMFMKGEVSICILLTQLAVGDKKPTDACGLLGRGERSLQVYESGECSSSRTHTHPHTHTHTHNVHLCTHTQANTTTYGAEDMCGSPATDWGWRDPGLLHQVKLDKWV